jgi:ribosome-associated toxin RatA of RatAB toxin-antitoxin module
MRGCLQHLVFVSFLLLPLSLRAEPVVKVERQGDIFAVRVETAIAADAAVAWQVLTDYNRLADFVPDMRASRVLSAPGQPLRIEQQGEAGFLLFKFAIDVELAVEETPPQRLAFRAIRGNMKHMRGEWRIESAARGILLVYDAELAPAFWVPPVIGPLVLRRDVASQIAGVVREIERRQAALPLRAEPAR